MTVDDTEERVKTAGQNYRKAQEALAIANIDLDAASETLTQAQDLYGRVLVDQRAAWRAADFANDQLMHVIDTAWTKVEGK